MTLRQITLDDLTPIQKLLEQLKHPLSSEQICHKITIYDQKDEHYVWGYEENKCIVGLIAFFCYESFVLPYRCLWIDALIVDQAHRGKGIGKQLVKAAETYGQAHNCQVAELLTFTHRKKEGTHDFYENIGYQNNIKTDITYFSKDFMGERV